MADAIARLPRDATLVFVQNNIDNRNANQTNQSGTGNVAQRDTGNANTGSGPKSIGKTSWFIIIAAVLTGACAIIAALLKRS